MKFYFNPIVISDNETATEKPGCSYEGSYFNHGQYINTTSPCVDCYCDAGTTVCAEIECQSPSPRCLPAKTDIRACCPSSYTCREWKVDDIFAGNKLYTNL